MSSHHSEQMSQRSQVSRIALRGCSQVFVFVILYWILLLSTNICKSRFDFDIYLTIQSFRCNRTLISGVSIITGTNLKYKRSKAQKVKVAGLLQPLSLQKHMKHLLWKNSNWILQFSPSPSPPLLLPLPWVPPYWGPKGRHHLKKTGFFRSLSERGGGISPNPKFPNQKMIEIFLDFFAERGEGVSPNPKFQ